MNPELARTTIVETLRQKFDDARFLYFIRNLVNHLDESKKQTWTQKKAAFEDFVNHFTRLGTYTDPDGEKPIPAAPSEQQKPVERSCVLKMCHYRISVAVGWLLFASAPAIAAASPVFEKDIRPILKAHCFECHGEGGSQTKADHALPPTHPSDN